MELGVLSVNNIAGISFIYCSEDLVNRGKNFAIKEIFYRERFRGKFFGKLFQH
jgi:hypothetical protein